MIPFTNGLCILSKYNLCEAGFQISYDNRIIIKCKTMQVQRILKNELIVLIQNYHLHKFHSIFLIEQKYNQINRPLVLDWYILVIQKSSIFIYASMNTGSGFCYRELWHVVGMMTELLSMVHVVINQQRLLCVIKHPLGWYSWFIQETGYM